MRCALSFCLALASATLAHADEPLTAEAFDALTLGRTMTWSEFGSVYGVEQYLPGRQVRWTLLGEDCTLGHWYPDGEAICFQYEDDLTPDCWLINRQASGLVAHDARNPTGAVEVLVEETSEPLACFGPEVGV